MFECVVRADLSMGREKFGVREGNPNSNLFLQVLVHREVVHGERKVQGERIFY